ncbi:MAG: branched-chain amino acid ABC transporter permease [Chloroflexi bacterium]|uniref:Branched-chain amino acid ABC transporter permease n=1 Tax=Candidatus Chlorohelix allophototropha TaxID=3003348 RepID=A0A8T7LUB8_9CHLR|nr:branched-chain amino acid ABC transporter permease [Chloroflexota bacterium]WJW67499.1 branched-chain amino acid ABC transporter permease [Chloroflexota bacterium L227-S17]
MNVKVIETDKSEETLSEAAQKRMALGQEILRKSSGPLGISRSGWVVAILALALLVLPLLGIAELNQRLIAMVLIFAAYAMSYDLLFGYTGIFSFGHALFFGVGAYTTALCALKLGWPIWSGAILGALICAVLGVFVGFVSLRVQGVFFAMVTLALATTAHNLSSKLVDITKGDEGLSLIKASDAPNATTVYLLALALAVISYFGLGRLINSPLGRVLISIRENERRAEMIGFNILSYKVVALVFSSIIASLAGTLYGLRNGIVNPGVLSGDVSLLPLLMVILGGAGTLYGALIGATLIEVLNFSLSSREFVENVKGWFIVGPILEHWLLLLGLIYALIVLFLPFGIVGTWRLYRTRILGLVKGNRNT